MNKFLLALALLAVLVSACKTPAPEPVETATLAQPNPPTSTASPTATPTLLPPPTATTIPPTVFPAQTSTPYTVGPDQFPATINPLTGLLVSDPNLLNRRPMAIKVQLYPRGGRPLWGVSLADIVYDYYQNDGLTRLNAIFYGNDAEQIGPVRSARLFDENIIRMYESIFAFAGAADYVLNRFNRAEYADRLVTERPGSCPPLCRIDPAGFNYLVASSRELALYALQQGLKNDRQNLDGMSFNTEAPQGGLPGERLTTRYSVSAYNRWDYDPTSGRYLRFQDTQEDDSGQGEGFAPLVDGWTNRPISADNVVVLFLPHQPAGIEGDRSALDIRLSGSGDAIAFRDGQAYKVRWNRPTKDLTLFLTFENGTFYPFKPGDTWYQVVGQSTQVTEPAAGEWRFKSQMP